LPSFPWSQACQNAIRLSTQRGRPNAGAALMPRLEVR
jgi:hypothetical protein